ncbi:MAG: hypothetical protein AUJ72_04265 [Candidatus Omnitrophica bacterium CG1_02_46_14]|nr:MAG: hypothetical protein AUJ72_04265 [Candidatus Omnitrophica bacterium CG1_02_46_14]
MRAKFLSLLRIVIGLIFVISGFIKLMQPYQNFLLTIQSYELLSGASAVFLAKAMPWAEFIVGIFLVLGLWSRFAMCILWVFNSIFIGVLSYALIRKLPIQECGCFGESFSLEPSQMLGLDIGLWLAFLLMTAYFEAAQSFGLDKRFDK